MASIISFNSLYFSFFVAAVNLHLLQNALSVVAGVELAVSRSAIPMQTPVYVEPLYQDTSELRTSL